VTFGGGVAGDLGGFIAATWLRGIDYVQVPTSLEAAIDASIGGKTAINLRDGKNLVGAFHQPVAVLVDTDYLTTLPERELVAGLAESVKHAAIRDADFVTWHEDHAARILAREPDVLAELIQRNCAIKAAVVEQDERESGLRVILNYGHTLGHAFEHLLSYELRHGECVALGILAENEIACVRGSLRRDVANRLHVLLERFGAPTRLPRRLPPAEVLAACESDKKARRGRLRFVLLRALGQPEIVEAPPAAEIEAGLEVIQPG